MTNSTRPTLFVLATAMMAILQSPSADAMMGRGHKFVNAITGEGFVGFQPVRNAPAKAQPKNEPESIEHDPLLVQKLQGVQNDIEDIRKKNPKIWNAFSSSLESAVNDQTDLDDITRLSYKKDIVIGLLIIAEAFPKDDIQMLAAAIKECIEICIASPREDESQMNGRFISNNFMFVKEFINLNRTQKSSLPYLSMAKEFCDTSRQVEFFVRRVRNLKPNLSMEQAINIDKGLRKYREKKLANNK